jgi:hypothetical protein
MPQYWPCSCQHVGRSTGAWCCCWFRHDGGCCLGLQQLHHGVVRGVLQVRCQVLWCSERCALLVCWMCGPARANQQKQFFLWLSPQRCSMQAITQRMTQALAGMQPAWEHCEQLLLFVTCSNLSSPAELRAACDSMTESGAARWTSYSCCMVQSRGNSMPMSGVVSMRKASTPPHGATCLEHAPTPCCPRPHSGACYFVGRPRQSWKHARADSTAWQHG